MTVTGLFVDINHARDAVQDLIRAGFDAEAINFVARHEAGDSDSATHDAKSGALYGGGIGLLIGLSALTVSGVGAIVAAGAIVTALAGAGIGAAGGFLVHALGCWGVTEQKTRLKGPHPTSSDESAGLRNGRNSPHCTGSGMEKA